MSNDNFELLEQVKEEINKIPGIEAVKSSLNLLDIMAAGVTKGNALKDLAEILKIKREEIIAIGDNHNDISMLAVCRVCHCSGKCRTSCKRHSGFSNSNK